MTTFRTVQRHCLCLALYSALLAPIAQAANPTDCTGGGFDPPNNGGSTNFVCAVSGNVGAITNVELRTVVFHQFAPCVNEHTFRLLSPIGTTHLVGTRNGTQTVNIAAFNSEASNGNWTLRVSDSNPNDACGSSVTSWRLTFTLSAVSADPSVTFADSALSENGAPAIRVLVSTDDLNPTTTQGTVDIQIDSGNPGSAVLGEDYSQSVTTLSIPAGTPHGSLFPVLSVVDDAVLERSETIGLRFANPDDITASSTRHEVTLSDDETGQVQFLTASSQAAENGSPRHSVPVQLVPFSSDGMPSIGLSLFGSISRQSGSATQGVFNGACPNQDWSFFDDPISFNPSDDFFLNTSSASWTPRLQICDDGSGDSGETIVLRATIDNPAPNVSVPATHTVTIVETAAVTVADASAAEAAGNVTFQVQLSAPAPSGGLTVDYTVAAGGPRPGTPGNDFTSGSGNILIAAGASSGPLLVPITNNSVVEQDETFALTLTGVDDSGFLITDADAIGEIDNDDSASVAIGNAADAEGDSGSKPFGFTVTLSGEVEGGFNQPFQTANDSATSGSDYTANSGSLSFNGTQGEQLTIFVAVTGDTGAEDDERFFVNLGTANRQGVSSSDAQGEGFIVNDDLFADVAVAVSNGQDSVLFGQALTYTITVSNLSPVLSVPQVDVVSLLPAVLQGVTWTCNATAGASCSASGSGDIADTVALPPLGNVVYTLQATADPEASVSNVTVTAQANVDLPTVDPALGNNTTSDSDLFLARRVFGNGFEGL
jgi:uncharacterized repeat protein (TIGR01451 family)